MRIAFHAAGASCEIALIGELDHHAARTAMAEIRARLDQSLPASIDLDMRQVTFMDSSGIALILALYKHVKALDGKLRLFSVSPPVRKTLAAAGMDKLLDLSA